MGGDWVNKLSFSLRAMSSSSKSFKVECDIIIFHVSRDLPLGVAWRIG